MSFNKIFNAITALLCSFNISIVLFCFKSHILIVLSALPDASFPSLIWHNDLTPPTCPFKLYILFPLLSKIFIKLSSQDIANLPSFNSIISVTWSLKLSFIFVVNFNSLFEKYAYDTLIAFPMSSLSKTFLIFSNLFIIKSKSDLKLISENSE